MYGQGLRAELLSLCVLVATTKSSNNSFCMCVHLCVPTLPPLASCVAGVPFTGAPSTVRSPCSVMGNVPAEQERLRTCLHQQLSG